MYQLLSHMLGEVQAYADNVAEVVVQRGFLTELMCEAMCQVFIDDISKVSCLNNGSIKSADGAYS